MNPFTGHLIAGLLGKPRNLHLIGYEPVPPELVRAAKRALAGEPETQIDLRGRSKLAEWAKRRRRVLNIRMAKARRGRRS